MFLIFGGKSERIDRYCYCLSVGFFALSLVCSERTAAALGLDQVKNVQAHFRSTVEVE